VSAVLDVIWLIGMILSITVVYVLGCMWWESWRKR
jgi:hypothetical protein